jgi:hypothetical protein
MKTKMNLTIHATNQSLAMLAALISLGALATLPAVAEDADQPSRAARLSFIGGTVSFQPVNVKDWTPAELNHPLSNGDHLWTEANSKAELQIGNADLRLNGRTDTGLTVLTDQGAQFQVTTGTLSIRLSSLAQGETFEIDTPQLALNLLQPGVYRIDVGEQGDFTTVTVRSGQAEIAIDNKTTPVQAGAQIKVAGSKVDQHSGSAPDAFDAWCQARDHVEDISASARFVSRQIPGYADLDAYGSWRAVAVYGNVWFPKIVVAGWTPYRFGHWSFVGNWGWTWVDDAVWGYAPFHYGRWVTVSGTWGWVPGPIAVRPIYAPALVAFSNYNAGVVVAAEPAVGWFPLGPGEVYVPSFRCSPAFLERINVTNTTIADKTALDRADVGSMHYMHRDGATTAMRHGDFTSGRQVGKDYVRVPQGAMARGAMRANPGLTPRHEAFIGNRGSAHAAPPRALSERHVAVRGQGFNRSTPAVHPAANHGFANGVGAKPSPIGNHVAPSMNRATVASAHPIHTAPAKTTAAAQRAVVRPTSPASHVAAAPGRTPAPSTTPRTASRTSNATAPVHTPVTRPMQTANRPATPINRPVQASRPSMPAPRTMSPTQMGQSMNRPNVNASRPATSFGKPSRPAVNMQQAMARNVRPTGFNASAAPHASTPAHNVGGKR